MIDRTRHRPETNAAPLPCLLCGGGPPALVSVSVSMDPSDQAQLTAIAQTGLTSEEARTFIETMPTPEELLPPLAAVQLPNAFSKMRDLNSYGRIRPQEGDCPGK